MTDNINNEKNKVYFVTGGGTGGHIYPAVAVGFALQKEPDTKKVYYIGNPNNLEKKIAEDKVFDFLFIFLEIFIGKGNGSGNYKYT